MRVLGIDPGSRIMGYGMVEESGDSLTTPAWGAIKPSANQPIEVRLSDIYSELLQLIDTWQPENVAIEEPFVGKNRRTIFALGQAQAVILLACGQRGIPVFRYAPAQTKRAVADYGNATKEQVNEMVQVILGADTPIAPQDASDALAVALCHIHHRRFEDVLSRQVETDLQEIEL
jgi:crossover junction endodeoxyribonuclease RuvC